MLLSFASGPGVLCLCGTMAGSLLSLPQVDLRSCTAHDLWVLRLGHPETLPSRKGENVPTWFLVGQEARFPRVH
jgi:hypothetical protein